MYRWSLCALFAIVLADPLEGVVTARAASTEECSGSITAEEVLRAEDARYAAQIANDFAAMEQVFGPEPRVHPLRRRSGRRQARLYRVDAIRRRQVPGDAAQRRQGAHLSPLSRLLRVRPYREERRHLRAGSVPQRVGQARQDVQFVSWQSTRVPPKQ